MILHMIILLMIFALMLACDRYPQTEQTPLSKAIQEQQDRDHERQGSVEHFRQTRQAVINHMGKYFAEWKIEGISVYSYTGGPFNLGVDSTSADKRQTFWFRVDMFVKDDGELYWKAEYIPPGANAKPSDYVTELYTPEKNEE